MSAPIFLLTATALHAGFQLTVSSLVYPVLAAADPQTWQSTHARHSRLITPMVVVTYLGLLIALPWALWTEPSNPWVWVCAVAVALTFAATAFGAAPTHQALTPGKNQRLIRRLLVSDQLRALGAVVALAAAALAL
ncbi:hypothetical protein K0651_02800 [Ornithinimicrobium sp. Arc0846-15]|nr:hypothetical protein [Ornithinimicrobium laminariae]